MEVQLILTDKVELFGRTGVHCERLYSYRGDIQRVAIFASVQSLLHIERREEAYL